jgi:hypothetical protein
MKKNNKTQNDGMLAEYDFSNGIRGKYAARYAKGSNIAVLEPDVASIFPNSQSVNEALRSLIDIASKVSKRRKRVA